LKTKALTIAADWTLLVASCMPDFARAAMRPGQLAHLLTSASEGVPACSSG